MRQTRKYSRIFLAFLPVLGLSGCALFAPPPHKPVPVEKPAVRYDSSDYVTSIALVRLQPENSIKALKPYVTVANAYSEHAIKNTTDIQPVVVFEYKATGSNAMQRVAAPVDLSAGQENWAGLQRVAEALAAKPHTLHHVRTYIASIERPDIISLKKASADSVRHAFDVRQQRVLASAAQLPVLEDATLHLNLVQYFTRLRMRDAAYLSLEDAKQLLALATQQKLTGEETIARMVRDLTALEADLRQTMPY